MLKSREFFRDTCFSHSYMTLFPSGTASFWYMLLFISDHCTIPVVLGLLERTVRTWQDIGNWSLGLNPLRHPDPYSLGDAPCQAKPTPGTCTTVSTGAFAALPGFEARSDIILMYPSVPPWVPPPRVWETIAQKAAPAPMGKSLPAWKCNFESPGSEVQQESKAYLELEPIFLPSQVRGGSGKRLRFNQQ